MPKGATAATRGKTADGSSSPQTWLLITSREMWSTFERTSQWAFHRHSMPQARRIQQADHGIVYLTRGRTSEPSALAAGLEFTEAGRMIQVLDSIGSFYPYRLPFRVVRVVNPPMPFRDLLPKLTFIPRRDRWGVFLQGKSAILLPDQDAGFMEEILALRDSQDAHP